MTVQQQLLSVFRDQSADGIPNVEFGYWEDTLKVWHRQGLPENVTDDASAEEYFDLVGVTLFRELPIKNGLFPPFERTVLSKEGDREIIRDEEGNICEVFTESSSIPRYVKFGLESREDWERIRREHLDPIVEGRVGDVGACLRESRRAGQPVFFHAGSLYGWLRNWMGVEGFSIAVMTDRGWVEHMMDHLTELTLSLIERALPVGGADLGWWWEDMCYNRGPLISPNLFEDLMVPRYKRVTGALRERGIDINVLDCDGRIHELAPGWVEAGINCMFPLEAAHTDVFALRRELPSVLLMGGIDKRALIAGRDAIDAEVRRLRPLIEQGRYVPCVDHRVPPDVTLSNYRYYLDVKRRLLDPR